ncbi:common central domain of tyrosinase-domain-containing protein [Collybia nuda]|uniref:tyrosinase n=1 Tax=Collybia nuda TaxID=64659 RepID=A0A9P5YAQ3_9AGAR|nr:common central domain of tyrosinase-domain-containing protein [Collybia nuda]
MSDAPYYVTGSSATGEVYPRLEIQDLVKKREQFSLFIQAWLNIRDPNSKNVPVAAQHVQIGGIHGLPYENWPGDPAGKQVDANWQGYCNHGSVLFPTWHRPYIMLLEQSIGLEAQRIVKELQNDPKTNWGSDPAASKKAWEQAANELRFPFWDWTSPETGKIGLPPVLYEPTLSLAMPDGSTATVENILAFYDFGSKDLLPTGFATVQEQNPIVGNEISTSYFDEWTRTYRWPNSVQNGVAENYKRLNDTLIGKGQNNGGSYKDILNKVAQLFLYPFQDSRSAMVWDQFSNTRGQSKPSHNFRLTSLESPHNTIHLVVGGSGGHMMDNDYAGPIFFLHHCNVDRLLAFWEYVYPSYWLGKDGFETPTGRKPFTQADGTWSEKNNAILTEVSELEPYRRSDGKYWIANDTRFVGNSTFPKYYTYPPIDGVSLDKPTSDLQRAQDLRTLQRYFGQKPTVVRDRQIPIQQALFTKDSEEALPKGSEPVWNFRQFVITVEVVEHAFENSHFLEVAYTSKDGHTYPIGATAVLSRSHGTQCSACRARQHGNSKVHDTIHIPHDIVVKIMTDHDLNHKDTDDNTLCDTIRKSLKAHIISPDGATRAEATPGEGPRHGQKAIDEAIRPNLRLASANVCAIHDKNEEILHPWELYDWKDHGPVLGNEWVVPT